jgi:hypothetical protein
LIIFKAALNLLSYNFFVLSTGLLRMGGLWLVTICICLSITYNYSQRIAVEGIVEVMWLTLCQRYDHWFVIQIDKWVTVV